MTGSTADASNPGHAVAMLLQQATAHHRRGALDDAATLYRAILAQQPEHFDALQLLGAVEYAQGRHAEAAALIGRALAVGPAHAAAWSNLGLAQQKLHRPDDALASFDRALALRPDHAPTHFNRGNALAALGRPDAALASYDRALVLRPTDADAHYARATLLLGLERHADALAGYDRVLALTPRRVAALNNRGIALLGLLRYEEALASYDRALAVRPDNAEVLANRGNALRALRRHDEALADYDRALALKPEDPDLLASRGSALYDLRRYDDAVATYERLLACAPDHRYAKGLLLHAKMCCCDWTGLAALGADIARDVAAGRESAEPFGHHGYCESPAELLRCAQIHAAARYPAAGAPLWTGGCSDGDARIRIGYVSGEFRHQATSILMAELFELHDRGRFELFAFDNGWDDGTELRRRIVAAFDEFVDISRLPDAAAAATIRDRGVDVLINLNGYFGRGRQGVFALRPSPLQVNYLGFPGTLGADYIDYVIADATVIPPGDFAFYTEKVVHLPDCYQVNDRRRPIAERVPDRADAGLPDSGFVFCCFNNDYKITPTMFDVWMRLLQRVPRSVLWLLEDNPAAAHNLRREAEARGIAAHRLVFAPRLPLDAHLARHRVADLFLDTLPYNAHTTASDALWAGLPVLTTPGTTFPGRVAASLLAAAGAPELVAPDLAAYEATAAALVADPARLAGLRARLAAGRGACALFDTDRFCRNLEAAFVEMVARQRRGEAPAHLTIAPARP